MIAISKGLKKLTVAGFLRLKNPPKPRVFYKYGDNEDLIQVQNNTFNLVLSREVKKNVRIATAMAFDIATQHPDKDVWYINTYSGVELLKETLKKEMKRAELPIPETEDEEEHFMEELQPNLFMVDVPFGEWDTIELAKDIVDRSRKPQGVSTPQPPPPTEVGEHGEEVIERPDVVVIINSFELRR